MARYVCIYGIGRVWAKVIPDKTSLKAHRLNRARSRQAKLLLKTGSLEVL